MHPVHAVNLHRIAMMMIKWLRRRRIRGETRHRLQMALARSEEALLDTHVENVLHLFAVLGDEREHDELLEIYVESLGLPPTLAMVLETRVLARMGGWGSGDHAHRRNPFSED